jgi:L-ascorbate metabolism protein UlaG (beta-lactamase superfamily)
MGAPHAKGRRAGARGWGESPLVAIRWYGQSCFEIREGDLNVVTDPHDGKSVGLPAPRTRAHIVLKTHDHFDHNCVRQVQGPQTALYEGGQPYRYNGFSARSIPAHHDSAGGTKLGEVQVMAFTLDGVRFCHLSDIGHVPTAAQAQAIGPVDILMVPTGGVFTIDAEQAWKTIELLNPRVAVPMHYRFGGLSVSLHDLKPFLESVPGGMEVTRVGSEIDVEGPGDLPEDGALWVFSV